MNSFRETIRVSSSLAYLSLGSNLGNRVANLRTAVQRLARLGTVRKMSSFYETEPVEVTDQPWFVNCVIALEFDGRPQDLLRCALSIEHEMGRERVRTKGPRTVDIDILLFGDFVVDEPGLKIPHPAINARRFVLEPLDEIAPDLVHPALEKTPREMLAALPAGQAVRRLSESGHGGGKANSERRTGSRKPTAR